MKNLKIKTNDNLELDVTYFPVKNELGIVQIIHGAKEHKERYYEFINVLNENGYSAIVSDNRGHGKSINEIYPLGTIFDYREIIEDQYLITKYIKTINPNSNVYLFGHSLGSMIARVYLEEYDLEINKLILSGTANYIALGKIGIVIGNILGKRKGNQGYSKLLERFANFLDDTWVVGNPKALEKYRNDPLCNYKYPITSMIEIFKINQELHHYKNYKVQNKNLPILSISGELDPITGGKKGIKDTIQTLENLGYKKLTNIIYKDMYHEVLNELDRDKVYKDIIEFLNK